MSLLMALAVLAPTTASPPPPIASERSASDHYLSEAGRAGISRELFERPVKPGANLVKLFSTDDYPLQSIRNGEEGTVGVILRVGPDGGVRDCIVTGSSGHPALDSQTCRILWARAHFTPARDRRGRPIESATSTRIRWELPEAVPTPFEPWSYRVFVQGLGADTIGSCRVEVTGAIKNMDEVCEFFRKAGGGALGMLRRDAGLARRQLIMETVFDPSGKAVSTEAPKGFALVMRQSARLTIDENGKPIQCRVADEVGPQLPSDCEFLLRDKFTKPPAANGAIEAVLSRSLFVDVSGE